MSTHPCRTMMWPGLRRQRGSDAGEHAAGSEREEERGSLVDLGRRPDPAAVEADDPGYDREPDARAIVLPVAMQALEWLEQLVGIGHVEPGTGVTDVKRAVVAAGPDLGTVMLGSVLPC